MPAEDEVKKHVFINGLMDSVAPYFRKIAESVEPSSFTPLFANQLGPKDCPSAGRRHLFIGRDQPNDRWLPSDGEHAFNYISLSRTIHDITITEMAGKTF